MLYGGACYAGHGLLSHVGKQLAQRARHFNFGSAPHDVVSCISSCRPAGQQASALPLLLWGFFLCWCVWQPERTGAVTPVTRVGSLIRSAAKRVFFFSFVFVFHPPTFPAAKRSS